MNIKKFNEMFIDDKNKIAIDSVSYIKNSNYEHFLQFVEPYHKNITTRVGNERRLKGSSFYVHDHTTTFEQFERDMSMMERDIKTSRYVFKGEVQPLEADLGELWSKSIKENEPLYVLRYVSVKDGIKRYSEEGLKRLKEKYPDLVYNK